MHIFVIAGETSGDTHAAALLSELRSLAPDLRISGLGGPNLHALSPGVEDWTHDAAVVGLWDVLRRYGYFRRKFRAALDRIGRKKPDAVLFVDYPGFNLRLARALQPQRPRLKLLYYISPQVWAWNRARIPRMARWLDRMFCIFPFEKELYEKSGLHTDFVGHPMTARREILGDGPRGPDLLALLPGSREREVRKNFPVMLAAAKLILARRPQTVFAGAASSENLQHLMHDMAAKAGLGCDIGLRNARELMQTASAGLVASGTATLEAALCGLPYALVYKVAPLTYFAGRAVIKVPHLGMANLMSGREIIREFIQGDATPPALASEALRLLDDAAYRARMREDFAAIRQKLVAPAAVAPARAVLDAFTAAA
ncbi:MAG: lipid-A-disaccharide synthase [Chthoniobacterales bacterium]|nr:lipid-A-disaccharide synthase [Chthoniobacterales bacterium]